jgi:hypothetical protein
MATGTGKTVVMAMLIAWQTVNKVMTPSDARFAKRPPKVLEGALRSLYRSYESNHSRYEADLAELGEPPPNTGELRSRETDEVALWMIGTAYNGESFFVRHCYFTGGQDPYKRLKNALKADIDEEAWASLYRTESRAFARPASGKIAVKVINDYGDEVLKVLKV